MKLFVILLFITCSITSIGQPKLTKMTKTDIPKVVKYSGEIVQVVRWKDSTGDNIVLLTKDETQSKSSIDQGYSDASLYAYHFTFMADSIKQTWRVYDYVKECPVDLTLDFVAGAFAVTDLNRDGKSEVWIMYKVSCQGDVSPIPMKIIMYQDNKKFTIRGTTQVTYSETEKAGGEFSFDDAFKKGPSVFRDYAEKLWKQHKVEKWGE